MACDVSPVAMFAHCEEQELSHLTFFPPFEFFTFYFSPVADSSKEGGTRNLSKPLFAPKGALYLTPHGEYPIQSHPLIAYSALSV